MIKLDLNTKSSRRSRHTKTGKKQPKSKHDLSWLAKAFRVLRPTEPTRKNDLRRTADSLRGDQQLA
jgi:hypothetical protein